MDLLPRVSVLLYATPWGDREAGQVDSSLDTGHVLSMSC